MGGLDPIRLMKSDIKCNLSSSHCTGSKGKTTGAGVRELGSSLARVEALCHEQQKQRLQGLGNGRFFSLESWTGSSSHDLTGNGSGSSSGYTSGEGFSQLSPSQLGDTV